MPESPRSLSIRSASSRIGPLVVVLTLAAACADASLTAGSDGIDAASAAGGAATDDLGDSDAGDTDGSGEGATGGGTHGEGSDNRDAGTGDGAAGGGAEATGEGRTVTGVDGDGTSEAGGGDDDATGTGDGGADDTGTGDGGSAGDGDEGGAGGDDGTEPAIPTTTAPAAGGGSGSDGSDGPAPTAPAWLGSRVLPTTPGGAVPPQTTPDELIDRRFATVDTLPPPAGDTFASSVAPLAGEPLGRSTWNDGCPVGVDDLRYVTVTFWGFDNRSHQGELIVHRTVADDIVTVFEALYTARYPIEEMRIVTQADLDAPPTGDGNNTSTFACRAVTGGSRFSEHAYGLAIDLNPFQNPYVKGDVVLPELATIYGERGTGRPGMISEGDPAVQAFDAIGWGWGGRWRSLKDYQHFALNDR